MRAVQVGSLTFDVQTAGTPGNPVVLLLHGYPQTSHAYRHVLPALADAGYFAAAPNQRGYSPRARPTQVTDYATTLLVQDALTIVDRLREEAPGEAVAQRFHVVGHDWGGQLAWLMAARYPQRLCSLSVLSRPHPRAFAAALKQDPEQSRRSRHHRTFDDLRTAQRLLEDGGRRLRRGLLDQGVAAADAEVYLAALAEPGALDAALHWYRAARIGSAVSADVEPPGQIEVPTLYIWGDADATVGRLAAESTGQWIAAAYRFEVLRGVGHFLTDQAPERVTRALLDHLRRHSCAHPPA